jgi:hypothetical protein
MLPGATPLCIHDCCDGGSSPTAIWLQALDTKVASASRRTIRISARAEKLEKQFSIVRRQLQVGGSRRGRFAIV